MGGGGSGEDLSLKTKKPAGEGGLARNRILMVLEGGLEPPQVALLDP